MAAIRDQLEKRLLRSPSSRSTPPCAALEHSHVEPSEIFKALASPTTA